MPFTRPTPSLFRKEALEHAGSRDSKTILLTGLPGSGPFIALLMGVLGIAATFLAGFETHRKIVISGSVQPERGLTHLLAPREGIINALHTAEGDAVGQGATLFVIRDEHGAQNGQKVTALLHSQGETLKTDLHLLEEHNALRLETLAMQRHQLENELRHMSQQLMLQRQRVELAGAAYRRFGKLRDASFISSAGHQERHAEWLDHQSRLAELQRSHAALVRQVSSASAEHDSTRLQNQRDLAEARRKLYHAEQALTEHHASNQVTVTAPHSGLVSAITVHLGQSVQAQQRLANLVPENARVEADLLAPSRAIGMIRPGMPVLIRYRAYPYQTFGQARGTVREIAGSSAEVSGEALYRVKVALARQAVTANGQQHPLKSGMALEASILLEKRTLLDWLLEPIHRLSRRDIA